jgi:hypothetical protein
LCIDNISTRIFDNCWYHSKRFFLDTIKSVSCKFKNIVAVGLNRQLEVRKLLDLAINKITFKFSQHIMGKTQKKSPPNTPPSTGAKTRKTPRQQKATERERGSGPVGRGGKLGKMGGRVRPFYTSSALELVKDDPSTGAKTRKSV